MIKRVLPVAIALTLVACLDEPDPDETGVELSGPRPECPPGETWDCYPHPFETDGIGVCQRGTKTCDANGFYGACVGDIGPSAEVCGDGLDNDCDRQTDEDCGGPICVPTAEVCGDGLDNDCDGNVDEGCVCPPGQTWDCYPAPLVTDGIGTCQRGTKTCNADGLGWGACVGAILPVPEVCGDGLDNNCDGTADDGCQACVPTTEVCGDGLDNNCDGNVDEGCCAATTEVCGDGVDNDCDGDIDEGCSTCTPAPETCGDGVDNDCDGDIDEGCLGDRAWNDSDRDGLQDAGEVGLPGVTFLLRTSAGALVAVTVSAADGSYWFANVPPGDYYMEAIPPFMYTLSGADAGTDDTIDNDFDGESGATGIFSFSGSTGIWDAGFYFVIQS